MSKDDFLKKIGFHCLSQTRQCTKVKKRFDITLKNLIMQK